MLKPNYGMVIVGGGNSAGYAAREYVALKGSPGQLCIITSEPYVSYERPALSKAYLFPEGKARLPGFHSCVGVGGERQTPEWYAEHGIDYVTSTLVTGLDVTAKTVTTNKGDVVAYDKLILATGARPIDMRQFKTPGADKQGIYYLRDVESADALLEGIAAAKAAGNKAVVVGGGYIGMEVAAALSKHGLDISMVFPESRLMERFFTPDMAAFYEQMYTDKGIKLMKGDLVTGFNGGERVSSVTLKSGAEVPADMVVVGAGAAPNTELAKGQLDLLESRPGGIKVDKHLQTSNPDVFAIGDIAAFPLEEKFGGAVTRQEHVTHCRLSAAYAVKAALQGTDDLPGYYYLPFFYSRIFDLSWQFYGVNDGTEGVKFGDPSTGKFGAFFVKNGKVVGAFIEGGSPEENAAMKTVAEKQPAAPDTNVLTAEGLDFASKL